VSVTQCDGGSVDVTSRGSADAGLFLNDNNGLTVDGTITEASASGVKFGGGAHDYVSLLGLTVRNCGDASGEYGVLTSGTFTGCSLNSCTFNGNYSGGVDDTTVFDAQAGTVGA